MKRLIERFARLGEDQLTALTLIFAGLTVVSLFIIGALWIAPSTLAAERAVAFTPTVHPRATLPPTWTTTPAPSPTLTATPRPATPTATPAAASKITPLEATLTAQVEAPLPTPGGEPPSPTAEPDVAATIAAAASPTPEPPPPPTAVPPTFPRCRLDRQPHRRCRRQLPRPLHPAPNAGWVWV
ncbi:MAG: hypothetical protein M5U01_11350 [Ardenticatenaceae bacterium]|nr:hypothetical protein [Ardenticatenaceae bacterium]